MHYYIIGFYMVITEFRLYKDINYIYFNVFTNNQYSLVRFF